MTIALSANTPRVSYTVNQGATQTAFTVNFEFFDDADLNFYVDGTKKTLTTHYTVAGGNGSVGTINTTSNNTVTGASGGSTIVITRNIALARTTDFPSSGAFKIGSLNTELDRFVAIASELNDDGSRSIKLADNDTSVSMELPLVNARKGTVLGFNASTGAVEAGPTIANVNALSAITANINTVAGIASDIAAVENIKANVTTVAGVAGNVTTVAGIASNVTTVAGIASAVSGAGANAVLAEGYAVKVDGAVESGKYSSKAWALGGDGVTDTAGSGSAKSWAVEADAVDGSEHSAKSYAISGNAISAGSAKQWALGGGSGFSSSTAVSGGLYSAKYWAEQSALSKTEFSNIYQGTHSSDPSGGSVSAGDLYFNSSSNVLKFYTGSAWNTVEAVDTSALASNGFAVAMAIAL